MCGTRRLLCLSAYLARQAHQARSLTDHQLHAACQTLKLKIAALPVALRPAAVESVADMSHEGVRRRSVELHDGHAASALAPHSGGSLKASTLSKVSRGS